MHLLYYFIFFFEKMRVDIWAYKEARLLHCKGWKNWEEFSPGLKRKNIVLGFMIVQLSTLYGVWH